MSERFIKFIPSEEAMYLVTKQGHAFRLLTIIAEKARRYEGGADGLHIGEALIGGHQNYDMTEQNYRTAKDVLVKRQHMKIVETSRTRKKATNGVTTTGTRVKLLSSTVYDINSDQGNERTNERVTNAQRMPNDELIKKRKKEEDTSNDVSFAQSAERLRLKKDCIDFDFEKWEYIGFAEKDLTDWKAIYPHIDVSVEITKSINWLKSNPTKNKKTLWRKFLTGWLSRSNESAENKKAYRAASGSSTTDRRTKDINGNPVDSPYTGKF